MIELKSISKVIEKRILFEKLNITFNTGSFNVITGISGSGKSTLFNIIGGLDKEYKGDILVNNNKIKYQQRLKLFDYLFQNYGLVDSESVKYNLKIVAKKSDEQLYNYLKLVKLNCNLNQKVYTLSGGEQQRLSIARLLISNRDYILADEPTASLDIKNRNYIIDMLIALHKLGKTIILITHDEAVLNKLKDYNIYMLENSNLNKITL